LLQHKADFNLVNDAGLTAIDWAEKDRHSDIADILRAAGEKK
jgi:ankyrin repeat protein